jgi:hypothetical protein
MTDYVNEVQKLYVAYFSRPADPAGLSYWVNDLSHDPNGFQRIAAAFSATAEYRDTYAGMNNAQVVSTVYQHLFGRPAEQAGVDYWSNSLNNGSLTVDDMVTTIARGAQGSDAFAFNAKVAVSTAFTARVDQPNETQAYSGTAANMVAIDFIATVKDINSAAAARDPFVIDDVISKIVAQGGTGLGDAHIVGVPDVPPPVI